MAKARKPANPKPSAPPVPHKPPLPPEPVKPSDRRYSMTELAALCGVTEQTVRRWWKDHQIPPPVRHGRTVYWPADAGNGIIDTYQATGRPSITPKAGAS